MLTIRDLPPELTALICQFLPRSGLRTARLLNKDFESFAVPLLFQTIFLKVNLNSYSRLANISRSEHLCRYVERLNYDGGLVEGYANENFNTWLECTATNRLGMHGMDKQQYLAQFSEMELRQFHSSYSQCISGQDHILFNPRRVEMTLLSEAFYRFPNLLEINTFSTNRYDGPVGQWFDIAGQILVGPTPIYSDDRFWEVLKAAECLKRLRKLSIADSYYRDWAQMRDFIAKMHRCLEFVEFFSFGTEKGEVSIAEDDIALRDLIRHMKALRSLKLHFCQGPSGNFLHRDMLSPAQIFASNVSSQFLRTLSLNKIVIEPQSFQELLQRHSATLRSLDLSNTHIQRPGKYSTGQDKAQWILMIQFLSLSMLLKHIRLRGVFTADDTEAWTTLGTGDDGLVSEPFSEACLRARIERYITAGGNCLFTLRTVENKMPREHEAQREHWHPSDNWVYEEDSSWNFAKQLVLPANA